MAIASFSTRIAKAQPLACLFLTLLKSRLRPPPLASPSRTRIKTLGARFWRVEAGFCVSSGYFMLCRLGNHIYTIAAMCTGVFSFREEYILVPDDS
jgi:hypothetical protein